MLAVNKPQKSSCYYYTLHLTHNGIQVPLSVARKQVVFQHHEETILFVTCKKSRLPTKTTTPYCIGQVVLKVNVLTADTSPAKTILSYRCPRIKEPAKRPCRSSSCYCQCNTFLFYFAKSHFTLMYL
jgi:hypothetical protein